jgi:hypothetical protein
MDKETFENIYKINTLEKDSCKTTEKNNKDWNEDCKKFSETPLPSILPAVKRIVAIGDLHGDWNMTIESLKIAGVIDNNNKWIGDDTIIVQIGDQIDRCRGYLYKCDDKNATRNDENSDVKILKFFTELHKEAQIKGGAVYSLLGNHELMNVMGDMRYVSYRGLTEFDNENENDIVRGKRERRKAFKRGNELASFMACTRQTALIIGSNLFVHAGIVPKLAEKYNVKELNQLIRKWLLDKLEDDSKFKKILKTQDYSPFWVRTLGQLAPKQKMENNDGICDNFCKPVLDIYNVQNMIIGHTPQSFITDEGINSTCDNHVWRVDVGVSDAFSVYDKDTNVKNPNRNVQVLEILNDKEFNVLK